MRLGQTSIIFVISKFATSVIGFFATIYFTRTLGEEVYGFYAVTLALVSWLGIVKSVGFGQAIVKRMSEDEEPDAYLAAGTFLKGILTILVAIGVLIFHAQVNEYVGRPVAKFVVLLLIASVFSGLVNSALQGGHKVHVYAPLSTLRKAFRSVVMVVLVYVGWELSGMLFGYAIGTLLVSAIGLWMVHPKFVCPRLKHLIKLFDFAKYSWLGSMRGKSFSNLDILILGVFVPSGLTGIYAVAYSLSKFLEIFGSALITTLFPEMSKQSSQENMELIGRITNDALTFSGLFLVPGIIGAAILGDRLMLVYGPNFDAGHWVLVVLLISLLIYTYTRQILNTLNAIDRPDLAFRANAIFIIANVVLNIVLIWQLGLIGAAVATALSAAIGLVFAFHYAHSIVPFSLPMGEISRQWLAALVMGGIVYFTREFGKIRWEWINDYNAVFVVTLVGLGAAVYFIILLVISSKFRTTIDRNLPFDVPLVWDR